MNEMKKTTILAAILASPATAVLANSADDFAKNDPLGWIMAVISMAVVFSALLILFLCFKYIYPLFAWCGLKFKKSVHRKKQYEQITDRRAQRRITVTNTGTGEPATDDEALAAAIAISLFLHEDGMHDQESNILTLAPGESAWTGPGNNLKRSPMRRF